jgi:fatty acid desaturase
MIDLLFNRLQPSEKCSVDRIFYILSCRRNHHHHHHLYPNLVVYETTAVPNAICNLSFQIIYSAYYPSVTHLLSILPLS